MRHFSTLRRVLSILITLSLSLYCASPSWSAPAKESKNKGIPANPPKKKLKGIPVNTQTAKNDELTEEEKMLIESISKKTEGTPAVVRQRVALPAWVLAATPPSVPQTSAPKPPSLPVGDPNAALRRIPQPPAKIKQPAPPSTPDPSKKKR